MKALVFVALLALSGCGHGRMATARAMRAEVDRCIANEHAIVASCATQAECRAQIARERIRCDHQLRYVCEQGRGCE